MKKYLFFVIFALYSGFAVCTTVTIGNTGFAFTPADVTINFGDTVNFQLGEIHNAVEVSEATWLENGSTALPGFSLPFGGGQVTDLAAGVHFYVCTPHASGGMKGKITVTPSSGTDDFVMGKEQISIYPNPTHGKFTLQFKGSDNQVGSWSGNDQQTSLEIFSILGEKVYDLREINSQTPDEIDLSTVTDGIYFVRINDRKNVYTQKLVKQ